MRIPTLRKLVTYPWRLYGRWRRDPLLSVPEYGSQISAGAQFRYGSNTRHNQVVADMLVFGVQYVGGAAVLGEIAEFGCMTGRTAKVLAAAMASFGLNRKLHLYDSFEGLPESTSDFDKSSFHVQDRVWGPGTCKGISPETLRSQCRRFLSDDQIVIHQGWFSETMLRTSSNTVFGLLHVDCDLYQSALDVLDYAFSKRMVAEGALMLFDDWNCNRASNDYGERKAWQDVVQKYKILFSDSGDYGWSGHKLIVHSYQSA